MTSPLPHERHHYTCEDYLAYERDSVSQERRVESYRRLTTGSWEYLDVRKGVVKLDSGATLDLSILYEALPH